MIVFETSCKREISQRDYAPYSRTRPRPEWTALTDAQIEGLTILHSTVGVLRLKMVDAVPMWSGWTR